MFTTNHFEESHNIKPQSPSKQIGRICMKGSIHFRKDRGIWFVSWYSKDKKKPTKIYRYKGEYMYDKKIAQKLLAMMQSDTENGTFLIEKYTGLGWTDTVPYLYEWLEVIKEDLSPGGYKDYHNSIKNHLEPFFKENNFQIHEIQYDVLRKLLKSINREGKGKQNVMYCLHNCLTYAWKSKRIPVMPPSPEKKLYKIVESDIQWLPEARQMAVINEVPDEHKPIILWLKYHLRRPGEAMALHRVDYNLEDDSFIIRRGISGREYYEYTKTKKIHIIPCHSEFKPYLMPMLKRLTKYMFTCKSSRTEGKRYTDTILNKIWNDACKKAGEDIPLYAGTKHSSCSQYYNEKGLSMSDIQVITDHARLESVKRYTKTEVVRKRELMETKVLTFPKRSQAQKLP
jgi:integrase